MLVGENYQEGDDDGSQEGEPGDGVGEIERAPKAEPKLLRNQDPLVAPIEVDRPDQPMPIVVGHAIDGTAPRRRSDACQ